MTTKLNIGLLSTKVRERRGTLSQREAAKQVKVSFSTISRVENGGQPDMTSFMKICEWIGIPPGHFFRTPDNHNRWGKALMVTERQALEDWAHTIRPYIRWEVPFHVGSSLTKPTYHDVDVRVLLDDDKWEQLSTILDIRGLNYAYSLWGQKVTGLPIDFQFQKRREANELFDEPRSALGIKHDLETTARE